MTQQYVVELKRTYKVKRTVKRKVVKQIQAGQYEGTCTSVTGCFL